MTIGQLLLVAGVIVLGRLVVETPRLVRFIVKHWRLEGRLHHHHR